MTFGIFWQYTCPKNGTRVLTGHPAAFSDTSNDAVTEGRKIAVNVAEEPITPLCVVETDKDGEDAIYTCDEVYLGDNGQGEDEMFFDVTDLPNWAGQPWWPKVAA
jgi:hypothetical protein